MVVSTRSSVGAIRSLRGGTSRCDGSTRVSSHAPSAAAQLVDQTGQDLLQWLTLLLPRRTSSIGPD